MPPVRTLNRSFAVWALVAATLAAAGCASPRLDGQWSDPQLTGRSLRGATVLVACEAAEPVVQRLCAEQLAAEVTARGATAAIAPTPPAGTSRPTGESAYMADAAAVGARAVLVAAIALADSSASPGVSLGLGGFSFGGGGVGGGVGVSVPIGGGQIQRTYAANARLTDVATGRLAWTAKATSSRGGDVQAQMAEVVKTLLDGAQNAQVF